MVKFCCLYCENTLLQQLGPSWKADSLWRFSVFHELKTALRSLHTVTTRSSMTAEVRRSVTKTRLPGASLQCRSGASSKANCSVCHCQQIYHTGRAALETQSGPAGSLGFRFVAWQRLRELDVHRHRFTQRAAVIQIDNARLRPRLTPKGTLKRGMRQKHRHVMIVLC